MHNLCTYRSYNGIIISSMVLFCHFSLERGIIQCLLVMLCNQILSSLSPSDKYDFVICACSRNYEFHRSVLQADKKILVIQQAFMYSDLMTARSSWSPLCLFQIGVWNLVVHLPI
jgi:hypothetical protein